MFSATSSFGIRLVSALTVSAPVFRGSRPPEKQVILVCSGHSEAIAAENHLRKGTTHSVSKLIAHGLPSSLRVVGGRGHGSDPTASNHCVLLYDVVKRNVDCSLSQELFYNFSLCSNRERVFSTRNTISNLFHNCIVFCSASYKKQLLV